MEINIKQLNKTELAIGNMGYWSILREINFSIVTKNNIQLLVTCTWGIYTAT